MVVEYIQDWHFMSMFVHIIAQNSDTIVLSQFSHHLTDSLEPISNISV